MLKGELFLINKNPLQWTIASPIAWRQYVCEGDSQCREHKCSVMHLHQLYREKQRVMVGAFCGGHQCFPW